MRLALAELKGREVSPAVGGGGDGEGGTIGRENGGRGVLSCTGPLRSERCAEVGMGGEVRGLIVLGRGVKVNL